MKRKICGFIGGMAVLVVFSAMLFGCGGGGGNSPVSTPVACVSDATAWSPATNAVADSVHFTQTDNCGNTQDAVGTKNMWLDRDGGVSAAVLFKHYSTGVLSIASGTSDGVGGAIFFGVNNTSKNNLGVLSRINSTGTELFRSRLTSPLGNTMTANKIYSDSTHNIPVYSRKPLNDFLLTGIDMSGNSGLLAEVTFGYNLTDAAFAFDADHLLIGAYSASAKTLFYASMVDSIAPISANTPINPEHITVDAGGFNVIGQNAYMKYARDLSVIQAPVAWSTGANPVISDAIAIGSSTYIAGTVDGVYANMEIGNANFQSTFNILVGADKVQFGKDANGNLYGSIGSRFGKIDLTKGDFTSKNPTIVPKNVPWFISGNNIYFLVDSQNVYVVDLNSVR